MTSNLYAALRAASATRLDSAFLRVGGEQGAVVTFGDIDDASARIAAVLVEAGLQPGDRVVAQVPKSAAAVALYLGALRAGAMYVPLNEAYTPEEVAYFLADAEPAVVVFTPGRSLPAASTARLFTLDAEGEGTLTAAAAGAAPRVELAERGDEPVAMLYTSGTTGKPKGALLTTQNLLSNATALTEIWGFTSDDILVHALPIFHVHGLFIAMHCALLSACEVRFLPRFDARVVRRELRGATVMMGVPTFYSRLLADPEFGVDDCSSMRLFVSGSAPLTEIVHRTFAARTGHRILERYGMTETGMITSNPLLGERLAGTVGYPLPGVDVRVVDGTVEVKGPNVFAGYRGMPDKTAASFRSDGYFITGDLGSLGPDGRLTLSGRGTDLIISGGLNVYPKEIELILDEVDGIEESAVIGVPHPDLGDAVVAVVVATGDAFDPTTVGALLDGRLARFKHPKHIAVVAELPRNAMGKVEKATLRTTYAHLFT